MRYRIFTLDRNFRPLDQKVEITVYVRTYSTFRWRVNFHVFHVLTGVLVSRMLLGTGSWRLLGMWRAAYTKAFTTLPVIQSRSKLSSQEVLTAASANTGVLLIKDWAHGGSQRTTIKKKRTLHPWSSKCKNLVGEISFKKLSDCFFLTWINFFFAFTTSSTQLRGEHCRKGKLHFAGQRKISFHHFSSVRPIIRLSAYLTASLKNQ